MTKIGLIGFGTVGQSVARILLENTQQGMELLCISNRNVERKRVEWVPDRVKWFSEFDSVLNSEVKEVSNRNIRKGEMFFHLQIKDGYIVDID